MLNFEARTHISVKDLKEQPGSTYVLSLNGDQYAVDNVYDAGDATVTVERGGEIVMIFSSNTPFVCVKRSLLEFESVEELNMRGVREVVEKRSLKAKMDEGLPPDLRRPLGSSLDLAPAGMYL